MLAAKDRAGVPVFADGPSLLLLRQACGTDEAVYAGCWQIYDVSGLRAFREGLVGERFRETRDWLSYQLTPRAEIFRRDHSKARNLAGMQRLMRSNTFLSSDKV